MSRRVKGKVPSTIISIASGEGGDTGSINTHMHMEVMQGRRSKGGHENASFESFFLKGNGAASWVLGILKGW